MQIVFFCGGLAILVLSFIVVLNNPEQSSRLYPGSNVRFLSALPGLLLLLALLSWFFPEPLSSDYAGWFIWLVIIAGFTAYSAWVDASFKGGLFKRVMHSVVVNKQAKRISFKQALLRNIFKLVLLPVAPFNLYMMSRDFRRQSLHDRLSGTLVMWTPDVIAANEPGSSYEVDIKS